MKRTVLLYGLALAVLTALLKGLEYRYYLRDLSVEFYIGIVAALFTALGVWVGLKLTNTKATSSMVSNANEMQTDGQQLEKFNISRREFEVLQLMAAGNSNQEIADQLFISLNTVKTHSSNLFAKLEVKRRTQAVQRAKELGLLK